MKDGMRYSEIIYYRNKLKPSSTNNAVDALYCMFYMS